jgi:hypothetical protein
VNDVLKEFWVKLPKTAKVFAYIALSILLSELLIELANLEQVFFVRFLAQVINLAVVFLQEAVPAVRDRLKG